MQTYLVGGAVRDALMGLECDDYDYVVVGASEEDMYARGYENVGESFPVFMDKNGDQYALARRERKTGKGYQGFTVEFDKEVTLEDDLFRRDLTINAIAKDITSGQLIDPYNGVADMERKILRHVSPAFAEDPLRVVRLARFFARWPDFTIAPETVALVKTIVDSGEMDSLSDERFWAEMDKMFRQSDEPFRFFQALWNFEVMQKVAFFKDLFGEVTFENLNGNFKKACDVMFTVEKYSRVSIFVSLVTEFAEMKSVAIPRHVHRLSSNIESIRHIQKPTASQVFALIYINRGFDGSNPMIMNVIDALEVAERASIQVSIGSKLLKAAVAASRQVTSADFRHLQGKELGEAMNTERLNRIKHVMQEMNYES